MDTTQKQNLKIETENHTAENAASAQPRKAGIHGFKLFKDLTEAPLLDLLGRGRMATILEGTLVLKEDVTAAEGIYVILEGSVSVEKKDPNTGSRKMIGIMGRGDFFGEISTLGKVPVATATVVAQDDCKVLVIPAAALDRWCKRYPLEEGRFFRGLAMELCTRLQFTSDLLRAK